MKKISFLALTLTLALGPTSFAADPAPPADAATVELTVITVAGGG